MNIKVIEDAINTYEQIKKDLEGFLGKIASGSETVAEDTAIAIKARIVNIRDFLVPALKEAQTTATAGNEVVATDVAAAKASIKKVTK